jgi:hypothetical protein
MKNPTINALAKQLLKNAQPSEVVEQLLEELEELKVQLDNAGPTLDRQLESIHSLTAIKLASIHLHQLFNFLKVPNAIHSKVRFPDGLYEIRFTRLKTPKLN